MHLLRVTSASRPRKRWGEIVAIVLGVLCVLVLGMLIAIPPMIMRPMVDHRVNFDTVYAAEDFGLSAEKLTLQTDDGLSISAFRVHRDGPSVTAFYGHAKMLADHGYASILYDARAHGESEGDRIGLGDCSKTA